MGYWLDGQDSIPGEGTIFLFSIAYWGSFHGNNMTGTLS
jgi:hypothetical protein